MRTKAERRHHAERIKIKAKAVLRRWFGGNGVKDDAKAVGKAAAMHNTCPCAMCTGKYEKANVRKHERDIRLLWTEEV